MKKKINKTKFIIHNSNTLTKENVIVAAQSNSKLIYIVSNTISIDTID